MISESISNRRGWSNCLTGPVPAERRRSSSLVCGVTRGSGRSTFRCHLLGARGAIAL